MQRIAVTGASGFIGQHVMARLRRGADVEIIPIGRATMMERSRFSAALDGVDALVHLAGMNRGDDAVVERTNIELAESVAEVARDKEIHITFASSRQRGTDTSYGRSKLAAEEVLRGICQDGPRLTILDIPNVFGPGCRPFYNSVVSTFCHQLVIGEEPTLHVDKELELIWVADLAEAVVAAATSRGPDDPVCVRPGPVDTMQVSDILDLLARFRSEHFDQHVVPAVASTLEGNLYRTLVTYARPVDWSYEPQAHADERGSLAEAVRQSWSGGQVFFSTSRPGVVRGDHYHTRKFEKFCVLQGEGVIRLRKILTDDVLEYPVRGDTPTVVDIPIYYVHNVENIGQSEMLTLFWASEIFDPEDADTWREAV